jgi:hypothetical protein
MALHPNPHPPAVLSRLDAVTKLHEIGQVLLGGNSGAPEVLSHVSRVGENLQGGWSRGQGQLW